MNGESGLDVCGCCQGLTVETPVEVDNRPGLSAVSYRVGTYALFRDSMLARLSAAEYPALHALTSRADDDFSIALIDLWAMLADILTFYQERIANESYLRTATERLSVQQLARLIGYQLHPGVAAATYLAFTLQDAPPIPALPGQLPPPQPLGSVPLQAVITTGTKVQSVPGPGQQPQVYETVEIIEARVAWNSLRPRRRMPHPVVGSMGSLTLQGISTTLQQGDPVLIVADYWGKDRTPNVVAKVTPDTLSNTTAVQLQSGGGFSYLPPAVSIPTPPVGAVPLSDAIVESAVLPALWDQQDLLALAAVQKWSVDDLESSINALRDAPPALSQQGVFSFAVRASVFGYNAPRWDSLSPNLRYGDFYFTYNSDGTVKSVTAKDPVYPDDWEGYTLADDSPTVLISSAGGATGKFLPKPKKVINPGVILQTTSYIYLDGTYSGIIPGSWLLLQNKDGDTATCKVTGVAEMTRNDYAITSKVTRLEVDDNSFFSKFPLRETTVLAQSLRLDLAPVPIPGLAVSGSSVLLDGAYLELKAGQHVALTGKLLDPQGLDNSEVLTIDRATLEGGFTTLAFKESLVGQYAPDTVGINANVALATHGETSSEVLGGGSAQAFQTFTLRQSPLTYTQAATPSGTQTTLQVRVNGVEWHEVDTLYGHGPGERVYITRLHDDGTTTITFGDVTFRPPTGQDNIRVTYRKGSGVAGRTNAQQLSLLLTRALGVQSATNPIASEGGDDPEPLERARLNAPLPILTLDRIVSLEDYEDFARAYAGVAKSLATWTWDGVQRGVFVTVAGPDGVSIQPNGIVYSNLLAAMQNAGDPGVPLRVQSYRPAFFRVTAGVIVDPDYEPDAVLAAVQSALRSTFSFDARTFGQPVALSEVITAIQSVAGVVAVNVTQLYRSDASPDPTPPDILIAQVPQAGVDSTVQPGELLILDPAPLTGIGVTS